MATSDQEIVYCNIPFYFCKDTYSLMSIFDYLVRCQKLTLKDALTELNAVLILNEDGNMQVTDGGMYMVTERDDSAIEEKYKLKPEDIASETR